MTSRFELDDIVVDVVSKDIKHLYLRVSRADGSVRISAPRSMRIEAVRAFAASKLDWIRGRRANLQEQSRALVPRYVEGEDHWLWGERRVLTVHEVDRPPAVESRNRRIVLRVRPRTDAKRRRALLEAWYREQLRTAVAPLLATWEPLMGVKANRVFVRRMKTKWGSCNYSARTIRFNTELVHRPAACLEYVLVHELAHLLEPSHSPRFWALMDRFMPDWRFHREALNRSLEKG